MITVTHSLTGQPKVRAEMSLTVLAYNLKRVLNIVGVEKLLEVVVQRRNDLAMITIRQRMLGMSHFSDWRSGCYWTFHTVWRLVGPACQLEV